MARRLSWPAGVRRWRRWIAAVLVVLALRAALPFALRPLIASQASKALRAHVEVGDVDLSLLRCGVALKEVSVRLISGYAGHRITLLTSVCGYWTPGSIRSSSTASTAKA